ncbi:MAG: NADH-quinone oxidoreductase subunit NuoH [Planctomycetota bacterium]
MTSTWLVFLSQIAALLACFAVPLAVLPLFIWGERKICAWIQDRVGPNRVGPFGLLQPLADVIKLIFKEDVIPIRVDKLLFVLAPLFAFVPAMVALAVIPMGPGFYLGDTAAADGSNFIALQGADLGVGLLFLFAMMGLGSYALTFGGWASNSKYSQLGGIRASAQLISYEIALTLAAVAVLMTTHNPDFNISNIVWDQVRRPEMVDGAWQTKYWFNGIFPAEWNIFRQPLAFIIFFVAALAETNRAPFDLPEAEPELVGGYHTEYSSFKFAMFFMGEYLGILIQSALVALLFLGGWHMPFMPLQALAGWDGLIWMAVGFGVFLVKMHVVVFVFMWIRWTFPRFRYDQLMGLGWKVLIPLAIANAVVTACLTM